MQKKPIEGVDVVLITGQAGGVVQTTKTDKKGEYTVAFREPQGSYSLSFRKVGYGAFTKTARQVGLSNILEVGDAVLHRAASPTLQPLVASANTMRRVPARGEIPSVGASEMNMANNGLFLLDPGDLNALAAPACRRHRSVGDSGCSVLGARAEPEQDGDRRRRRLRRRQSLPRDAIGSASLVVTNTFEQAVQGAIRRRRNRGDAPAPGIGDFFAATLRDATRRPAPRLGRSAGANAGPADRLRERLRHRPA